VFDHVLCCMHAAWVSLSAPKAEQLQQQGWLEEQCRFVHIYMFISSSLLFLKEAHRAPLNSSVRCSWRSTPWCASRLYNKKETKTAHAVGQGPLPPVRAVPLLLLVLRRRCCCGAAATTHAHPLCWQSVI